MYRHINTRQLFTTCYSPRFNGLMWENQWSSREYTVEDAPSETMWLGQSTCKQYYLFIRNSSSKYRIFTLWVNVHKSNMRSNANKERFMDRRRSNKHILVYVTSQKLTAGDLSTCWESLYAAQGSKKHFYYKKAKDTHFKVRQKVSVTLQWKRFFDIQEVIKIRWK